MEHLVIGALIADQSSRGTMQKNQRAPIPHPMTFVKRPGESVPNAKVFCELEDSCGHLNRLIPQKDLTFMRLMTFNVHCFVDRQNGDSNKERVLKTIARVSPDVVVLEEIPYTETRSVCELNDYEMAVMGFSQGVRAPAESYMGLGNVLYSKVPLSVQLGRKMASGRRSFASAVVQGPNGKLILVIGTHLDVQREQVRIRDMGDILNYADSQIRQYPRQIIMGDFNAWYDSNVLEMARRRNFIDSFDLVGWPRPEYTCWTGTSIDFVLIRGFSSKEILGSYVCHTSCSDHCPIIVDLI